MKVQLDFLFALLLSLTACSVHRSEVQTPVDSIDPTIQVQTHNPPPHSTPPVTPTTEEDPPPNSLKTSSTAPPTTIEEQPPNVLESASSAPPSEPAQPPSTYLPLSHADPTSAIFMGSDGVIIPYLLDLDFIEQPIINFVLNTPVAEDNIRIVYNQPKRDECFYYTVKYVPSNLLPTSLSLEEIDQHLPIYLKLNANQKMESLAVLTSNELTQVVLFERLLNLKKPKTMSETTNVIIIATPAEHSMHSMTKLFLSNCLAFFIAQKNLAPGKTLALMFDTANWDDTSIFQNDDDLIRFIALQILAAHAANIEAVLYFQPKASSPNGFIECFIKKAWDSIDEIRALLENESEPPTVLKYLNHLIS